MTDVHSKAVRSKNMRAIRSKNTWPERYIRKILHRLGFRFRLHPSGLPSKPDIYLPKYKAVILINSCFWHGHDCYLFKWPKSEPEKWHKKIIATKQRDKRNLVKLTALNLRVLVVWECALKGRMRLPESAIGERLEEWLLSIQDSCELSWEGIYRTGNGSV